MQCDLDVILRRKLKHYNIPHHAHELTFSCEHHSAYLREETPCRIFLEELALAKREFEFYIWAYVLMPTHVHLLIYPKNEVYNISRILYKIKGKTSTRYRHWIRENRPEDFEAFCVMSRQKKTFRFWQAGGGFDRNLWNAKAIHYSIRYIEGNPVRAGIVTQPEDWLWSSARARALRTGLIPDTVQIPLFML